MRIAVRFTDRVGITRDILSVLATRDVNLAGVEMSPPHAYIDAPALGREVLDELREALKHIEGVYEVDIVDMLPGTRDRLHLDAVLAAMADPVVVVDAQGTILVANAAAASVAERDEPALARMTLSELFDDSSLQAELLESGFHVPMREITLQGEPFLLDVRPVTEHDSAAGEHVVGGVVTLHAPSRMGERIHALQHLYAAGFDTILGESPAIRALKTRAARVATVDAPLLISGETGTGKELVAHACHAASSRSEAPFLALNCAALPENLAESELFGYAPGAFTGAQRGGKPGLLELANHGTVFLDEIGEMSPYLQAKLLRFLNDSSFRRVGGERELKVDVRIISATHRNLEQMVATGAFREDLFYRLNVLNVQVPPLRERGDDIVLLAKHFIKLACAQTQRPLCRLTSAAAFALMSNPWPGNVRQLQNVVFRAVTMSDKPVIDAADLELAGSGIINRRSRDELDPETSLDEAVSAYEKRLLQQLYAQHPSARKLAARLKSPHTTIAYKLRKHGIPGR